MENTHPGLLAQYPRVNRCPCCGSLGMPPRPAALPHFPKDPEPTLRTSIAGGTTSQLDHTAGARYVQRQKGHQLPWPEPLPGISGGVFKLQHCFLTEHPHQPPTRRAPEASGAGTILSYSWKTLYFGSLPKVNLTTQVSLVSSSSSHCTSWTYALRRPL